MQLIFLGLDSTCVNIQASLLAKQLGLACISMLQLFSRPMRDRFWNELQAIEDGDRSFDTEVLAMLEVRLRQPDAQQGWILTDFPTSIAQAQAFQLLLEYMGLSQPQVFFLSTETLVLLEHCTLDIRDAAEELSLPSRTSLSAIRNYYQALECLTLIDGSLSSEIIHEKILEVLQIATFA